MESLSQYKAKLERCLVPSGGGRKDPQAIYFRSKRVSPNVKNSAAATKYTTTSLIIVDSAVVVGRSLIQLFVEEYNDKELGGDKDVRGYCLGGLWNYNYLL